jgi:hypothetical protein
MESSMKQTFAQEMHRKSVLQERWSRAKFATGSGPDTGREGLYNRTKEMNERLMDFLTHIRGLRRFPRYKPLSRGQDELVRDALQGISRFT